MSRQMEAWPNKDRRRQVRIATTSKLSYELRNIYPQWSKPGLVVPIRTRHWMPHEHRTTLEFDNFSFFVLERTSDVSEQRFSELIQEILQVVDELSLQFYGVLLPMLILIPDWLVEQAVHTDAFQQYCNEYSVDFTVATETIGDSTDMLVHVAERGRCENMVRFLEGLPDELATISRSSWALNYASTRGRSCSFNRSSLFKAFQDSMSFGTMPFGRHCEYPPRYDAAFLPGATPHGPGNYTVNVAQQAFDKANPRFFPRNTTPELPTGCRSATIEQALQDEAGNLTSDPVQKSAKAEQGSRASGGGAAGGSVEVKCPVCLWEFKCPKTLSCGHNICANCLHGLIEEQNKYGRNMFESSRQQGAKINCPLCRAETVIPPNGLATNYDFEGILRQQERLQQQIDQQERKQQVVEKDQKECVKCGAHVNLNDQWQCVECKELLCSTCCLRVHRSHTIVPVSEMTSLKEQSVRCVQESEGVLESKVQVVSSNMEIIQELSFKLAQAVQLKKTELFGELVSSVERRMFTSSEDQQAAQQETEQVASQTQEMVESALLSQQTAREVLEAALKRLERAQGANIEEKKE